VNEAYVLSVDFGTANTYLSRCGSDSSNPQGIQLDQGSAGIESVVLYRPGDATLIGAFAANTFGSTPPRHRQGWRLQSQFKPDIATSTESKEIAEDFLRTILTNADASSLHLNPAANRVIFGVPSEVPDEYVVTLKEIAAAAGFGNIETYPEPMGALVFHIVSGQLPLRQGLGGGLVIDFGGGTCDFSLIARGEVLTSWGDFELGGRLFDDLFFTWFIDTNLTAIKHMEEEDATYFVHAYECRRMKEFFSTAMERSRDSVVPFVMGRYGEMQGMTWREFQDRAKQYRLSDTLRQERLSMNVPLGRLASPEPIDLIDWFAKSLMIGLGKAEINKFDVDYVLLTGGSSMWPFVAEVVKNELGISDENLIRSSNPYAAISEGLAALPSLQARFGNTKSNIERDLDTFFKESINPLIAQEIDTIVESIGEELTQRIFDRCMRPVLDTFREKGGSVSDLKVKMAASFDVSAIDRDRWIEKRVQLCVQSLTSKALETTYSWLASHGITVTESRVKRSSQPVDIDSVSLPDIFDDASTPVAYITAAVVTTITANLAGGAGIALVKTGPVGLAVGAIVGLLFAYFLITQGKVKAQQMAASHNIPSWVAGRLLSAKKIEKIRMSIKQNLSSTIRVQLEHTEEQVQGSLRLLVEREVAALTAFQNL
jgi:molecular chaperone DnaK (HSP70)